MAQSSKNQEEQQSEVAHLSNDMHDTNATVSINQITEFVDEASIKQTSYSSSIKIAEDPYVTQDLLAFLQRPFPLQVISWKRTDLQGSCLCRIPFPDALFNVPALWSKLQNFQFMRAGVQISIRINATSFHYGKLMGVWRPFSLGFTTHDSNKNASCTSYDNLYSLSSYPHILISPTSTETSIIKANFALPLDWIDLDAFTPTETSAYRRLYMTLGVFELWVLNPLKAMGVETDPPAHITLFSQFCDLKLAGFSSVSRTYKPRILGMYSDKIMPTDIGMTLKLPSAQSGDIDQNNANVLPGIRKIAFWPLQLPNSDVQLPAMSLSLVQNCSHIPVQPANLDLLSFLSKPCLLDQFEITKTTQTGRSLKAYPVMPYLHPRGSVGGQDVVFHTRLSFLASVFQLWRGTIRYHFNVVCSRFHSLRIRIYWVPGRSVVSATEGVTSPCLNVNKVIDIQGECDFFFDVPWLCAFSNLATRAKTGNGTLIVDLLNPIVYPEQVIPPVQVNVWVSAGPDFEFAKIGLFNAVDFNSVFVSTVTPPTLTRSSSSKNLKSLPEAQAGEPNQEIDGGPVAGHDTSMTIAPIVGEKISSLRQVMQKPSFLVQLENGQYLLYSPPAYSTVKVGNLDVRVCRNWLDYLQLAFVGSSGAIEFLNPLMKTGMWLCFSDTRKAMFFDKGATTYKSVIEMFKDRSSGNFCYFEPSDDQRAVILPYYSNLNFRPNKLYDTTTGVEELLFPAIDMTYMDSVSGDKIVVMQKAGNSFNFHLPMGIPAMLSYVPSS